MSYPTRASTSPDGSTNRNVGTRTTLKLSFRRSFCAFRVELILFSFGVSIWTGRTFRSTHSRNRSVRMTSLSSFCPHSSQSLPLK